MVRKIAITAVVIVAVIIVDAFLVRADASLNETKGKPWVENMYLYGQAMVCSSPSDLETYLRTVFEYGVSVSVDLINNRAGYTSCRIMELEEFRVEEIIRYWGPRNVVVGALMRKVPATMGYFLFEDTRLPKYRRSGY